MADGTSNLVIGLGEVGNAIKTILQCDGYDIKKEYKVKDHYETIHICIPYSDTFVETVREYQKRFTPKITVIHSSVPVGTSRKLKAVHSPVRGVHPQMVKGIKTFVKFFGGKKARKAANIFKEKDVHTYCVDESETTEALKLWDTTQYGIMILLNKEIKEYCDKFKLDFDIVYTMANATYNDGYRKLGRKEVVRPYLKFVEGKIGGHCVVQNADLLASPAADRIKTENAKL
jgi:UDP-N-acetyl-D-mannosaminuronate dehydrogenase